jgi:hypothetical protein
MLQIRTIAFCLEMADGVYGSFWKFAILQI